MHYKVEVLVDLPREKMIELFDNPDNLDNSFRLSSTEHLTIHG